MSPDDARAVIALLRALAGDPDVDLDDAHTALDQLADRAGRTLGADPTADIDLDQAHTVLEDACTDYSWLADLVPYRRIVDVPGCDKAGIT